MNSLIAEYLCDCRWIHRSYKSSWYVHSPHWNIYAWIYYCHERFSPVGLLSACHPCEMNNYLFVGNLRPSELVIRLEWYRRGLHLLFSLLRYFCLFSNMLPLSLVVCFKRGHERFVLLTWPRSHKTLPDCTGSSCSETKKSAKEITRRWT
jgi:hypothetical protein